jgi:hypothetical protein
MIAGIDLSTQQFYAVIMGATAFTVMNTTLASQRPIGILQNNPNTTGLPAEVAFSGICKMMLGDTVTSLPALLGVTASGRGQVVTDSSGSSGRYAIGEALQLGTSGDVIMIKLFGSPRLAWYGTSGS